MNTLQAQPGIKKNHMDILWHDYSDPNDTMPIISATLPAKASVIGRVGIMMLACGTGAWRVRSSMNTLSELMDITCTVDIGLMSINYTCIDGNDSFSQSLCLTNTGVNTSQLNRLEKFVSNFSKNERQQTCEQIHSALYLLLFLAIFESCFVVVLQHLVLYFYQLNLVQFYLTFNSRY